MSQRRVVVRLCVYHFSPLWTGSIRSAVPGEKFLCAQARVSLAASHMNNKESGVESDDDLGDLFPEPEGYYQPPPQPTNITISRVKVSDSYFYPLSKLTQVLKHSLYVLWVNTHSGRIICGMPDEFWLTTLIHTLRLDERERSWNSAQVPRYRL